MQVKVEITLDCKFDLEEVTKEQLRSYLKDAIHSWGGQLFPGDEENDPDPLFYGFTKIKIGKIEELP